MATVLTVTHKNIKDLMHNYITVYSFMVLA